MRNFKLILILSVILASVGLIKSYSNMTDTPEVPQKTQINLVNSEDHHKNSIPQRKIENIAKPAFESAELKKEQTTTLNMKELEGSSRNEYGIRDDILRFIEVNVPQDNKKALAAAIKAAQYQNQVYYHSTNQKEAIEYFKKEMLAVNCFANALPNDWIKIRKGIRDLMSNNAEREKHMWEVIDKYFTGKALGTGLNDFEEAEKCKSGNF